MVPASIPHDCSQTVDSQVNSFIQSVPNGSTIEFQPGGCYGQDGEILVTDRSNLTIDGNGSTFKDLTTGTGSRSNWDVQSGSNITLENMTIIGANANAGTGSSCYTTSLEWQYGINFEGTQTGIANHVTIEDTYGDFIEAQFDQRYSIYSAPPARNITVENSTFNANGRMGVGLTDVQGFTMQNSTMTNICMDAIDVELDVDQEYGQNINILNNTFGAMRYDLLSNYGAGNGSNVGNITVSGNIENGPLINCEAPVVVVPPSGYYRSGYTITNNHFLTYGDAVDLTRTDNATVSGNIVSFTNGGCGSMSGVNMTDSHTIWIESNTFANASVVDTMDSLTTGVTSLENTLF